MLKKVLAFVYVFLVGVSFVFADTVYLKNGEKVEGKVDKKVALGLWLEVGGGKIFLSNEEIESIENSKPSKSLSFPLTVSSRDRKSNLMKRKPSTLTSVLLLIFILLLAVRVISRFSKKLSAVVNIPIFKKLKDDEMIKEKRKFRRLRIPLSFKYRIPDLNIKGESLTKDIGGGGLQFLSNDKMNEGTALELIIETKERTKPFFASGKTVWIKEEIENSVKEGKNQYRIGLKFNRVDPSDIAKLFLLRPQEIG